MNQNNDYNQFGFDHYSQPPQHPSGQKPGMSKRLLGPTLGEKLRSPLFAGAALLIAGAAFAGIIVASYPSDDGAAPVIVKADTFAYKEAPENPGGMEIANRDSTVFSSMRDEAVAETAPVENLLGAPDQAEKLERFAAQVEEAARAEAQDQTQQLAARVEGPAQELIEPAAGEAEKPEPIELQKIVQKTPAAEEAGQQVAAAEPQVTTIETPQKPRIHKAGENPETLEFVRSVLDKKDSKKALAAPATNTTIANDVATRAAGIEPAAGIGGIDIRPGEHYVQLGSVRSASGAASEWGKIQGAFGGLLDGVSHRVKSADLGERGTFYRIQAGPMSADSAKALCDQIKLQKPQGCLVTR